MIQHGNTVKVHYTGQFDNNEVFDSSNGKDPIEFKVGDKQVIEGFENAVLGLSKGDEKTVKIPFDKAYGEIKQELIGRVPKEQLPPDVSVGSQLQGTSSDGQPFMVVVKEIYDNEVELDANHPLAGKDLTFTISIVDFF